METPPLAAIVPSAPLACPACSGPVDVKSRHVIVAGSAVRVFCSEDCLQNQTAPRLLMPTVETPEEPTRTWPHVLGISVGVVLFTVLRGAPVANEEDAHARAAVAAEIAPTVKRLTASPPDAVARQAVQLAAEMQEAAMVADLMQDTWFHPLAGPRRRMPTNHLQAFGAERPGERPPECVSGHCGVDVGGGLWGEPVHAAHEGIVDRVNRGPNEEHGGIYVRIAHREGTVFTWYFHLAAVPRWIQPGTKVEAGQIIGLVGDTGVKQSAPHLHFALSVKTGPDGPERYMDPESLLALWPLWIPDEDGATRIGRVSTREPPGLPMRGKGRAKAAKAKDLAAAPGGTAGAGAATTPAASGPAPAPAAPTAEPPAATP
jgi:murein DD-endopeptidase MepM/ murein hydrolase activator NlpD